MNTTTRRAVLTGAAALPLLPGAALAASVTLSLLLVSACRTINLPNLTQCCRRAPN